MIFDTFMTEGPPKTLVESPAASNAVVLTSTMFRTHDVVTTSERLCVSCGHVLGDALIVGITIMFPMPAASEPHLPTALGVYAHVGCPTIPDAQLAERALDAWVRSERYRLAVILRGLIEDHVTTKRVLVVGRKRYNIEEA